MKRLNFLIAASVIAIAACAGSRGTSVSTSLQSDTITVSGKYLDVPMKVTVVVPDSYLAEGDTVSYPVLYLLNGYGGSYKNWGMIAPLAQYANDYGCII
ncbi:MAG: hypothetical protein K2K52_08180, partial [Paramuribaculum sp.]|nr:hypothetical protein [Paramuribaculum sp.]